MGIPMTPYDLIENYQDSITNLKRVQYLTRIQKDQGYFDDETLEHRMDQIEELTRQLKNELELMKDMVR